MYKQGPMRDPCTRVNGKLVTPLNTRGSLGVGLVSRSKAVNRRPVTRDPFYSTWRPPPIYSLHDIVYTNLHSTYIQIDTPIL